MNRLTAALLAAALLLSALCFTACSKGEVPSGMKEASDTSIVDYHLYVPEDWTVDLQTGAVSAYYSKTDPSSVNVMAWTVEHTDYTPEDWWESGLADLSEIYTDLKIDATTETTLGGVEATQYVWNGRIGEKTYRFLQVAAVRRSMVYVFTYGTLEISVNEAGEATESGRFDEHLADVQQMLAEFCFT